MLKRFLFSLIVLILFGSGGDIIRLVAHCVDQNRGYNRMHEFKTPSTNKNYAQCQGQDEEGSMSAYAYSSADKDWYLEPALRRGVEYKASAGCSSGNQVVTNGYYSVEIYVPNKPTYAEAGFLNGILSAYNSEDSFTKMASVDDIDIFDELSRCNAGASVNGEHPPDGSGSERPRYQYATADGNW